jgi:glycosyltransferase domain-containing protein
LINKNTNLVEWALAHLKQPAQHLKQFDGLSNLTIIMPTFKRHDYVIRLIVYLSAFKVNLIIVDGSPEAIDRRISSALASVPRFRYHHRATSLPERIQFANQFVETEFVMLMADDDFYLPTGLLSAMTMLADSSTAVACMGQSIGLDVESSGVAYFFPYGESLQNYSVQHDTPIERVRIGIRNYRSAASYAVFKANGFASIWKDIESSSCPEHLEYEHAIRTYLEGGLVTVNETYWVRSFECDPVASAIDGNRANDFTTWYTSAVFAEEKNKFSVRLKNAFTQRLKISDMQAVKLCDEICGYIVSGSHTGLAGKSSPFIRVFLQVKLKLSGSLLGEFLDYLRSTMIGLKLRNYVKVHERKILDKTCLCKTAEECEYLSVLSCVEVDKN